MNPTNPRRAPPERTIRDREAWLSTTLASIGDALIVTDGEGCIVFLNAVAAALTRWDPAEARGHPLEKVFVIVDEVTRQPVESPVVRVLREGAVVGLANHTLLIARDGTEIPIDDSGAPIHDGAGRVAGVVLIFRDITERRQAERALLESEARKAAILESALDAIITIDHQGKILEFNPAAETIFGYSRAEAIGSELAELVIPPSLRERHRQGFARYLATGEGPALGKRLEMPAMRADGTEFPAELAITRIPTDGPPMFTGYVRDITERRRTESQIKRLNQDLERRFAELQALLDVLPIGIGIAEDPACLRIRVNKQFASQLGISPDANASLSAPEGEKPTSFKVVRDGRELLPEELPMQIAAARGVEVLDFECDVVHDDGTVVKLLEYAAPLFDEEGKTTGCVGAFLDITERTRAAEALRESQERLAGIVASAMDAIISVDEEQRILVFNAAAERMFRCRAEEMLGQPIDRLIPERFRAIHAEHIRHFGRTGVTSRSMTSPGTLTALRADGEEFPIEATISQVLVGHQKLFTVILRDVTERVQAEEALRRQAEELARVDRAKDQFLAMLAHELRNPIGAISNATQLQKLLAPAEPRVARALEIIERQVTHTRRLLDDLLNVSRIARGKISLNPIYLDLTWIVRDTAEDFRSEIEASGLSLSLDLPSDPVWVEGDPTRLAQALGNLLSNAVKFTERGGRITVQLTVDPGTRRAVVTVRDTGCGIAPEVLPHIFETFAQADRNRGGLGLGLPLVKGLVELHGGEVRSESEGVGRGAAFTILLPLAPAEAARHPDPGPAADPVEPKRILVVEDNPDVAKSLCTLLELLGCEVAVAYSGPEAMTLVPRFRPEIVFCDLGLPGMSGYEVATALQQEQATAPPRLIAVSGYGQEEDKRRARDAGFERHLTKPVDLEELRRVLSTHST